MLKSTQAGRHWGRHKTFLSYQSHLSVCIPGCLVVCLSVSFTIFIVPVSFCWSVSLLAYPSVCLFVVRWLYACVSVHLSVCLFICSSIDPSFICIFARLSFYSSVRPSVRPPILLHFIHQSILYPHSMTYQSPENIHRIWHSCPQRHIPGQEMNDVR